MSQECTCETCDYSIEVSNEQNIGQKLRECRFSPPCMICIQTSRGMTMQTMFPVVSGEMSCFNHSDFHGGDDLESELEAFTPEID